MQWPVCNKFSTCNARRNKCPVGLFSFLFSLQHLSKDWKRKRGRKGSAVLPLWWGLKLLLKRVPMYVASGLGSNIDRFNTDWMNINGFFKLVISMWFPLPFSILISHLSMPLAFAFALQVFSSYLASFSL